MFHFFFKYLEYIYLIIFPNVLFYLDFFFQAEDGIRDADVTGVQTCALPIFPHLRVAVASPAQHPAVAQQVNVELHDRRREHGRPLSEPRLRRWRWWWWWWWWRWRSEERRVGKESRGGW